MAQTRINRLQMRLGAARAYHAKRDIIERTAVRYYAGQLFRNQFGDAMARAPVVTREQPFMSPNMVAPTVWHWLSRQEVANWEAFWRPQDDSNPDACVTAHQASMWYRAFNPQSNMRGVYRQMALHSDIGGCGLGTWYRSKKAPGGIRVEQLWSHRLTTDPGVVDQELESHPYVIDSQVIPVSMARDIMAPYGVAEDDPIYETGETMNSGLSGDAWFGRYLYQLQPGIGMSVEPAIRMHWEFNDGFQSANIYLENASPTKKGTKPWKEVATDMEWHWGNRYWKLDCLPNPVCFQGDGLVTHLIPPADLLAYICAHELWTQFSRSSLLWLIEKDSLTDLNPLMSGEEMGILQKTRAGAADPHLIQMPKYDGSLDGQRKNAMDAWRVISGIGDVLTGNAIRSDQSFSTVELQGQQAKAAIEMVSNGWRDRTQKFVNNMVRAGVDIMARTDSKKFISIVGPRHAEKSLARVLKNEKTALLGPTSCALKQDAWLADTPGEAYNKIMGWIKAGRISVEKAMQWYFRLTGREAKPGQEATYANAEIFLKLTLDGAEPDVTGSDNLDIYLDVINEALDRQFLNDYSSDQMESLRFMKRRLEREQLLVNQQTGLAQGALGAAQESPEGAEEAQQPQMATAAAP